MALVPCVVIPLVSTNLAPLFALRNQKTPCMHVLMYDGGIPVSAPEAQARCRTHARRYYRGGWLPSSRINRNDFAEKISVTRSLDVI